MAKRVLIVDDDEMVRIALVELLKPEGYEVRTASGGYEALENLNQNDYDLLVLDIIMPNMDGIELCKKIREKPKYKKTPIVFLTAKSSEEAKVAGVNAGANLFLSKPISPEKLLNILSDALG